MPRTPKIEMAGTEKDTPVVNIPIARVNLADLNAFLKEALAKASDPKGAFKAVEFEGTIRCYAAE